MNAALLLFAACALPPGEAGGGVAEGGGPPSAPAASAVDPSTIPPQAAPCAKYAADAEVFGACITHMVHPRIQPAEIAGWCALAGTRDAECRERWVVSVMSSGVLPGHPKVEYPRADLIAACLTDACRFRVLDSLPDPDPVAQIDACTAHTHRFRRDCIGHALERMASTKPGAEALLRVARAAPPDVHDLVQGWTHDIAGCLGVESPCVTLRCSPHTTGTPSCTQLLGSLAPGMRRGPI
jgi:hypothetical protein